MPALTNALQVIIQVLTVLQPQCPSGQLVSQNPRSSSSHMQHPWHHVAIAHPCVLVEAGASSPVGAAHPGQVTTRLTSAACSCPHQHCSLPPSAAICLHE